MKNFNDFMNTISQSELDELYDSLYKEVMEKEKANNYPDPTVQWKWINQNLTYGMIFQLLKKYHSWNNFE